MKPSIVKPVMLRYSEASGTSTVTPDPSEYLRMTPSSEEDAAVPAPAEPEWFFNDFDRFSMLSKRAGRELAVDWNQRKPCLEDRTNACAFDRHYIYHTAWAARVLARSKPKTHVDISSSLYFS